MVFSVGDVLSIEDKEYRVVGKITYRNSEDNCYWDEYRMVAVVGGKEAWLSIDETYNEYSISWMCYKPDLTGYHVVDRGREIVMSRMGNVDVDSGEVAYFTEYEDSTEEKIISEEVWSDGAEYSYGHYVDVTDVLFERSEPNKVSNNSSGYTSKGAKVILLVVPIVMFALIFLTVLMPVLGSLFLNGSVEKYLEDSDEYVYQTSVTGNEQEKADVYMAATMSSVDSVAKDILKGINGKSSSVQQNTEDNDNSVAILTDDEYCLVYMSDDNETVLVQVSGRKYAYTSDRDLYRGTRHSRRYYRRFYRTLGYNSDSSRYSSSASSYSTYNDTDISYNSSNSYNSYSSSVRQSSIGTRKSSGGGISSGK